MSDFFNVDYEKALLGQMLTDNSIIDIVSGRVPIEAFYDPKNRIVYRVILNEWKNNHCANVLTICNTNEKLSPSYVAELTDRTSSSSNFEFYIKKITECYISRKIKVDLCQFVDSVNPDNVNKVITDLSSKISSYMQSCGGEGVDIQSLCMDIPKEMQERHNSKKQFIGAETGYEELDDILEGFQTGVMYTIGARPSIGKTAFALNLMRKLSQHGIPSTLFSLEMSAKACFYRLLAAEANLKLSHLKNGMCLSYQSGLTKCMAGLNRLYSYAINLVDTDIDLDEKLYARIRYEAVIKHKKYFFIDHLGLITLSNSCGQRYLDVGTITKTLHKMAKELDVCIIILCQCGREAEGKKPNMSLLRESGNIEQDSDVIMFIHRERDMNEINIPTTIIVAKNRDGRTGEVEFTFNTQTQSFVEEKKKNDFVPDVKERSNEVSF